MHDIFLFVNLEIYMLIWIWPVSFTITKSNALYWLRDGFCCWHLKKNKSMVKGCGQKDIVELMQELGGERKHFEHY